MKPLVSIIIPIYNSAKYLAETVHSAMAQTWPNKEIILVDDGSTDNSLALANTFKCEWIKIFHQKNLGASAARNYGLKESKGDYIQYLDADDFLSENKIAEQVKILEDSPNHIGLCPTVYFDDGTNPYHQSPIHEWYAEGTNNTVDFLIKLYGGPLIGSNYGGMVQTNAWLIPKNISIKAGTWNEDLSLDDDGEYFCRILLASDGISYTKNVINYYRKFKNSSNLSSQTSFKAAQSAMLSIDLKYKHLFPLIENKLLNKIFCDMYWNCAVNLYPIHISLYKKIRKKIKHLGNYPPRKFYTHTKLYRFTTRYFGWKISAWISYIKLIVTQRI